MKILKNSVNRYTMDNRMMDTRLTGIREKLVMFQEFHGLLNVCLLGFEDVIKRCVR